MLPLRLLPLFKERPWGVRTLAPWFPAEQPSVPIGEAWFTVNENPVAGGTTLGDVIAADPTAALGRNGRGGICPLLVKFLFTSERLSVQVHPDDEYAAQHHGSLGKTEAWHVVGATPDAELGIGFRHPLARGEAIAAARSGAIENLLRWRSTAVGDTWLIPAGTVHAIGAGVTAVEIQENSDITYRLYDYGRPRELHLDHGFTVADLEPYSVNNESVAIEPGRDRLSACRYFTIERWRIRDGIEFTPGAGMYHLIIVLDGSGTLGGEATHKGHVWFVPAASDAFTLTLPGGTALVAYTSSTETAAFRFS
jgi:mannose-6-phosphate isomerase